MPDYSAGGLLADQALLPPEHPAWLHVCKYEPRRCCHQDAGRPLHGQRHRWMTLSAGWNRQCQKPVPTVRGRCSQKCSHLYWVRSGKLDHCPRYQVCPRRTACKEADQTLAVNEGRLPSGEVSIKVDVSGAGGDRQNLRLEIRRARSWSQVGGKPSRLVMQANAPVLSPDPHH